MGVNVRDYKAPFQLPLLPLFPPTVLGSSQTDSFQFLRPTRFFPASGPSQILFLLLEVIFLPSASNLTLHRSRCFSSLDSQLEHGFLREAPHPFLHSSAGGGLTRYFLCSQALFVIMCLFVCCLAICFRRMSAPRGKGWILSFSTAIPSTWKSLAQNSCSSIRWIEWMKEWMNEQLNEYFSWSFFLLFFFNLKSKTFFLIKKKFFLNITGYFLTVVLLVI